MKIAVFNKGTGRINRIVDVPVGHAALNAQQDEDWIPVTVENDETHYVDVATMQLVAIPLQPTEFHDWDATFKQWSPQLAEAKKAKLALLLQEYRRRKELPIAYDSKTLDTDEPAREQLLFHAFEFAERARLNQPAPAAARIWENADGTFHSFATDTGFRNWLGGFVITLSERTAQLRIAARQHAQAIRALTTVEDVLAYDLTTGWGS